MKKALTILLILVAVGVSAVIAVIWVTPTMDRWGATDDEIAATYPGDELVPAPSGFVNHAVTIHASPAQIYPWLVQLGAGKGGMYSYSWFETNLLRCTLVNADSINPAWQDLKVGDLVRMCPEESGPPPYSVAQIVPDQALVLGHRENDEWVDLWQFVIVPQANGDSRLILRTRTMATGGFWDIIHPGIFIMERGMLLGIQERAEQLRETGESK